VLVDASAVDQVVSLVRESGRTGYRGDGMIIVSPIDNVYKIRTDEKGVKYI